MILELNNIYKIYRQGKMDVPVLKDVSLHVEEGEYVAIMGPSGSGKTTLMNIIGCLDLPTTGEYYLDGDDISSHSDSKLSEIRLRSIGFVFQSFYLLSRQTALENVALPLLYAGVPRKKRIEIARLALERVGLGDRTDFKPTQLSGGQCQRVAIARAIVNNPKILLADEPTGALDTRSGEQIMEIFKSLNAEGVTVVMITHELEIAQHAGRVLHIRDGRFVTSGMKRISDIMEKLPSEKLVSEALIHETDSAKSLDKGEASHKTGQKDIVTVKRPLDTYRKYDTQTDIDVASAIAAHMGSPFDREAERQRMVDLKLWRGVAPKSFADRRFNTDFDLDIQKAIEKSIINGVKPASVAPLGSKRRKKFNLWEGAAPKSFADRRFNTDFDLDIQKAIENSMSGGSETSAVTPSAHESCKKFNLWEGAAPKSFADIRFNTDFDLDIQKAIENSMSDGSETSAVTPSNPKCRKKFKLWDGVAPRSFTVKRLNTNFGLEVQEAIENGLEAEYEILTDMEEMDPYATESQYSELYADTEELNIDDYFNDDDDDDYDYDDNYDGIIPPDANPEDKPSPQGEVMDDDELDEEDIFDAIEWEKQHSDNATDEFMNRMSQYLAGSAQISIDAMLLSAHLDVLLDSEESDTDSGKRAYGQIFSAEQDNESDQFKYFEESEELSGFEEPEELEDFEESEEYIDSYDGFEIVSGSVTQEIELVSRMIDVDISNFNKSWKR